MARSESIVTSSKSETRLRAEVRSLWRKMHSPAPSRAPEAASPNSPGRNLRENQRNSRGFRGSRYGLLKFGGGESVSQSPLKDRVFLTFLGQNPPFELRRKLALRLRSAQRLSRADHCESERRDTMRHVDGRKLVQTGLPRESGRSGTRFSVRRRRCIGGTF
jgi:hypothetical protein